MLAALVVALPVFKSESSITVETTFKLVVLAPPNQALALLKGEFGSAGQALLLVVADAARSPLQAIEFVGQVVAIPALEASVEPS